MKLYKAYKNVPVFWSTVYVTVKLKFSNDFRGHDKSARAKHNVELHH